MNTICGLLATSQQRWLDTSNDGVTCTLHHTVTYDGQLLPILSSSISPHYSNTTGEWGIIEVSVFTTVAPFGGSETATESTKGHIFTPCMGCFTFIGTDRHQVEWTCTVTHYI